MFPNIQLIDSRGEVIQTSPKENHSATIVNLRNKLYQARQEMAQIRARFDAAQTMSHNELHWQNADHFDPHSVASLEVRRTLRSRSRYEIIENNPFLKGTLLTLANDFVGSGPKLQITDGKYSPKAARLIEEKFQAWFKRRRLRQKLWRMRVAKITDGETFARAYLNTADNFPVKLDFQVIECDRVSSMDYAFNKDNKLTEIDGVRFDPYENATHYHILHQHPGTGFLDRFVAKEVYQGGGKGTWVDKKFVIHWFRQDRGWLRGIPELTPSLPLCALLRRYTLALVRHAETAADLTGVIETDGPANNPDQWDEDDPFDVFPLEMGMLMRLPWSYKLKQLTAVENGQQYDAFVGALLREITRPLLCTYNISSGSSKDANMASGILDANIYKGGQHAERFDAEEVVLDHMFELWWLEYNLTEEASSLRADRTSKAEIPKHRWSWDRIGLDHTDPSRVATAIQILHDKRLMTDRDFQEGYMNRSVEEWQEETRQDDEFRMALPSVEQENKLKEQESKAKVDSFKQKGKQAGSKTPPKKTSKAKG